MANIFLDSNFFFDITERDINKREMLNDNKVFVSALSYHILFYSHKHKVPQKLIVKHKKELSVTNLSDKILDLALDGPIDDLEDNIQLHSASEHECDVFLTSDKKLLKMKFFGKMRIVSTI